MNPRFDICSCWHVPDHRLQEFGLNTFVLLHNYLYIENSQGQVIFDGPVKCVLKSGIFSAKKGPEFMQKLTVQYEQGGFNLINSDQELISYVQQLKTE